MSTPRVCFSGGVAVLGTPEALALDNVAEKLVLVLTLFKAVLGDDVPTRPASELLDLAVSLATVACGVEV